MTDLTNAQVCRWLGIKPRNDGYIDESGDYRHSKTVYPSISTDPAIALLALEKLDEQSKFYVYFLRPKWTVIHQSVFDTAPPRVFVSDTPGAAIFAACVAAYKAEKGIET